MAVARGPKAVKLEHICGLRAVVVTAIELLQYFP